MKTGRNDPCPCGSGKKYKKCCLAQDEAEAARGVSSPPSTSALPPGRAKGEEVGHFEKKGAAEFSMEDSDGTLSDDSEAFWEAFEEAEYERKVSLAEEAFGQPWMDADLAMEVLYQLFDETAEHREHDRFTGIVKRVRERRPDLSEELRGRLLPLEINSALVSGGSGEGGEAALADLVHQYAEVGEHVIDSFNRTLEQLAYRGRLDLLVDAYRTAWPSVENSSDIIGWGIQEFGDRVVNVEILDFYERHPDAEAVDERLLGRLSGFADLDVEDVRASILGMTGRQVTEWKAEDFDPRRGKGNTSRRRRDHDDDEEISRVVGNLLILSAEFLHYARETENIPWVRAELGGRRIVGYYRMRSAGELTGESMMERMNRALRNKPAPKQKEVAHPLLPDAETLDSYIASMLNMMNPRPAAVAALLAVLPAWLRFLEHRKLIDGTARARTARGLDRVFEQTIRVLEGWGEDPTFAEDLRGARATLLK